MFRLFTTMAQDPEPGKTYGTGQSPINTVPGWFGTEDQGAGVALTNLTGNDRPDLLIFHTDNPAGENQGYYRVAFDLMPYSFPARWMVV